MKKTLLGLSAAALLLSFASCKKDYTCTCKYTFNGQALSTSAAYTNVTRGDAHDRCDATEKTTQTSGAALGWSNIECEVGD